MSTPKLNLHTREAELIERVCRGDKEAFYCLVQPCERGVFTAAMSILNNANDAEEVAQEAVLKAFTALPRFRGESKFSTWLIQITINEARLKLRKDRRHLYESIDEQQSDEEGEYFPKDFADWREIPSEVEHLSIQETAQVLGITEGSVKTRLLRARLQLRDALTPGIDGSWSNGKQEFEKVRPW